MFSNALSLNNDVEYLSNEIEAELINDPNLSSYVFSCLQDMDTELDELRATFSKIENSFQSLSDWSESNPTHRMQGSSQPEKVNQVRVFSAAC